MKSRLEDLKDRFRAAARPVLDLIRSPGFYFMPLIELFFGCINGQRFQVGRSVERRTGSFGCPLLRSRKR